MASAMVRPPPPGRPTPPSGRPQPPPPPPSAPPSKSQGKVRPPPPPPPGAPPPKGKAPSPPKRKPPSPPQGKPPSPRPAPKRTAPAVIGIEPASKRSRCESVSIIAPTVLRDVDAFDRKQQVGQGTYGSVFVGQDKKSREIFALKRINTEQEANGFPITAIREVKILKALKHENIVSLKEIVTSKDGSELPKNVYMVFDYCEYDLTGILDTAAIRFTQDHIKSWSHQLLLGAHYMHTNKIIHRDLKSANILINKDGVLKIADWGLARSWNSEMKRLTKTVITLWYRPPELLLGTAQYGSEIDMWSVGCIIAEMFRRCSLFNGQSESQQLDMIFKACGHPTSAEWPNQKCPLWEKFKPRDSEVYPPRLKEALFENLLPQKPPPCTKWLTDGAIDLISKLLTMDPSKRWSAEKASVHDYFFEQPMVKKPENLSMNFQVKTVHEWEARINSQKRFAEHSSRPANAGSGRLPNRV